LALPHERAAERSSRAASPTLATIPLTTTTSASQDLSTCALMAAGRVRCWGEQVKNPKFPLPKVSQLSLGSDAACDVTEGKVRCWDLKTQELFALDNARIPAAPSPETPPMAKLSDHGAVVAFTPPADYAADMTSTPDPKLAQPLAAASVLAEMEEIRANFLQGCLTRRCILWATISGFG
jgi:hypothetical protein